MKRERLSYYFITLYFTQLRGHQENTDLYALIVRNVTK